MSPSELQHPRRLCTRAGRRGPQCPFVTKAIGAPDLPAQGAVCLAR